MSYSFVGKILGVKNKFNSRLDLIALAKSGVSKKIMSNVAKRMLLTNTELVNLLPVSQRTIQRLAQNDSVNPAVSEHVIQLAEVTATGIETFNDTQDFNAWLHEPCLALNHHRPIELMDTIMGCKMVIDVLGRIQYGVYS